LVLGGVALLVLAGGAVLGYVLYKKHQGRNIRGSASVEFVTTQTTPKRPPRAAQQVPWPTYGRDDARLRAAPDLPLRPPLRRPWVARGGNLLEFPPAVGYGRLFLSNNPGELFALSTKTGRRAWTFATHRCTAASPALHDQTVFASFMNRGACNQTRSGLDGMVAALAVGSGKPRWTKKIGPTETSPLVANRRVY